jgi:hypothetical protein
MITYLTSAGVAAEGVRRGDPIAPETIRLAARRGRLVPTAVTSAGVNLYAPDAVERFFADRAQRRARGGGGGEVVHARRSDPRSQLAAE